MSGPVAEQMKCLRPTDITPYKENFDYNNPKVGGLVSNTCILECVDIGDREIYVRRSLISHQIHPTHNPLHCPCFSFSRIR